MLIASRSTYQMYSTQSALATRELGYISDDRPLFKYTDIPASEFRPLDRPLFAINKHQSIPVVVWPEPLLT